MIFEFDVEERLNTLVRNHSHVLNIKDSLSDNRSDYRLFSENIGIDFQSIDKCCNSFEHTLLIDLYTFSEQLFKNFFYEIISFEGYDNIYLENFVNSKVSREKFSPNVKYGEIEKSIKSQLLSDFKFLHTKRDAKISMYNEMIKSRHQYAHNGSYLFNMDNFDDIMNVLRHIVFELNSIIILGMDGRIELQRAYATIKTQVKKFNKIDVQNMKYRFDEFHLIRAMCKSFMEKYKDILEDAYMIKEVLMVVEEISNVDLRSKGEALVVIKKLIPLF